jgi:hypothetical protein
LAKVTSWAGMVWQGGKLAAKGGKFGAQKAKTRRFLCA